jgi:hypothetical protein
MLYWASGLVFANRPVRLITGPRHPHPAAGDTPTPYEAAAQSLPAQAGLPSVNVANANRWGPHRRRGLVEPVLPGTAEAARA